MLSKTVFLSVLLLVFVSWHASEAAIFKRPSKNERQFQAGVSLPIEEVHKELNRLRRAAGGDPVFKKTLLNDTSNTGLVRYAGNDSKVLYICIYICTYIYFLYKKAQTASSSLSSLEYNL